MLWKCFPNNLNCSCSIKIVQMLEEQFLFHREATMSTCWSTWRSVLHSSFTRQVYVSLLGLSHQPLYLKAIIVRSAINNVCCMFQVGNTCQGWPRSVRETYAYLKNSFLAPSRMGCNLSNCLLNRRFNVANNIVLKTYRLNILTSILMLSHI